MSQRRLDFIDVAKGFGILFVVWAHILLVGWTHRAIYAFHMTPVGISNDIGCGCGIHFRTAICLEEIQEESERCYSVNGFVDV